MPRQLKVRHVIPISGKDSLCTAIVQRERQPDLPYEYVFCDVGMELPETYEWLDKVERELGITITRIGKNLEQIIAAHGFLHHALRRYCTREAKIVPMEDYFIGSGADRVVKYLGYRADESDRVPPPGYERVLLDKAGIELKEVFPLVESGVKIGDVYRIIGENGLTVPDFFWQRLYDTVYEACASTSQRFMREMPAWTKAHLFGWRSRSNCFQCHYQRLYEWVGLLEHHPDLYAHAEEIERVYGGARSDFRVEKTPRDQSLRNVNDFTFNVGYSLGHIRKEAERIFKDRVKDVYNMVVDGRQKPRVELDTLSATSCGAYCGK